MTRPGAFPLTPPGLAGAEGRAATRQDAPDAQTTQQLRPVPTGSTATPSRVDPPTLVQPAVTPDAADTGSQPVPHGRR